jgi:hypothetical protein
LLFVKSVTAPQSSNSLTPLCVVSAGVSAAAFWVQGCMMMTSVLLLLLPL